VVDGDGNLLVADSSNNNRLQLLASDGTHLQTIGSKGSGPGQFIGPSGVAVDGDGNWLVADTANHRLQLLTPDGTHLKTIGSRGSGPGQFNCPQGVALVVC
jgi:DNA-binding beta-propeller fold protein YncE